jgi:DMSO/TMAO reductase YedYZ molybdopterin-dependent catalytic subunit
MSSRNTETDFDPSEAQWSRRAFMSRLAGAGLAAVGGTTWPGSLSAQTTPAKPAADPAGTVSNDAIMKEKVAAMKMHSERPLTASVTAEHHNFAVTPADRMFVRNNLFTPDIAADKHVLRVKGLVDKPLELTIADVKRFPVLTTQSMLECAGSGRTGFTPTPRGTPWPPTGGMGCPRWTGVSLADVLKAAGVQAGAAHVAFTGSDFGALPNIPPVTRSVPLWKAMERHTMIAFDMNGAPLPKAHGYPLRMVVPGWAGSASTKWLATIDVLAAPFKGPYMDESYRIPARPVMPGDKMPADAVSAEAWPVKSMITHPAPDSKFAAGKGMLVEGRAWAGDNDIAKVELSFNEGISWVRADLNSSGERYAWRVFSYEYRPRAAGYVTVLARATDDKGNVQPIVAAWNPLGYFWNGLHRVGFLIEG